MTRRAALALVVLLLPAVAHAQSWVGATATPNPFGSGATLTIDAAVIAGDSPEAWCFEWEGCYIVGADPWLEVYGPNSFYAITYDWAAQWMDTGPGQTMQTAHYTVYGGVNWTVCWGFYYCEEYYQYGESGSTPATATPSATIVSESVTPTSGSGTQQTFTFVYSTTSGAGDIRETWQIIHATGQTPSSCVVGFYVPQLTFVLWDDSGTGTPNESAAPLGSSAILENSQCRLHMSGVDRAGIGNLLSVTLTIEFTPSYVGAKGIYMYGKNAAGVYGAPHLAGSYTVVDCAYQVAPGSTTVPSSTGSLTLSVTTQPHCPWTAPGTSSFLNLTTTGSMMGSGQVSYTYSQNASTSARSTQPVIAGQTVTVTQVGNGQPVPGDEVVYYHQDAIGSVRAVTDASGVTLRRHDFMPFGQELQATATADNLLFTGQERDPETGRDYFGARYYMAQVERFTTVDPGHASGRLLDPQSWNGYAYARNNPLLFVDPDGRWFLVCDLDSLGCAGLSDDEFIDQMTNPESEYRYHPRPASDGLASGEIWLLGRHVANYLQVSVDAIAGPVQDPGEAGGAPSNLISDPSYYEAFRKGIDETLRRLRTDRCAAFFGARGPDTIARTQYRIAGIAGPETGAVTIGELSVIINTRGPFIEPLTSAQQRFLNRFWTRDQFRALILLHELGHQLSKARLGTDGVTNFGPDAGNIRVNERHSSDVIRSCF